MTDYFSKKEIDEIFSALKDLGDVGIKIGPYEEDAKTDREAFFGKAKLWHVIKALLNNMFFDVLLRTTFYRGTKKYQLQEIVEKTEAEKKEKRGRKK